MARRGEELEPRPIIQESMSSRPVESVAPPSVPCIFSGALSGFGGGAVGYFFGFCRKLLGSRKILLSNAAGWESARAFAVLGGVYSTVLCWCKRIRQKSDAWNGGIAGCATGLTLGWKGGPASALQSCVGFGVLSAIVDVMGKDSASDAAYAKMTGRACLLGVCQRHGLPVAQQVWTPFSSQALEDFPPLSWHEIRDTNKGREKTQ